MTLVLEPDMRQLVTPILLLACVLGVLSMPEPALAGLDGRPEIRLATGMEGGGYYDIGRQAERLSAHGDVLLTAQETQGSWENLILLQSGEADFALAQLDAVIQYHNYHLDSKVVVIRPLYTEYLHILLRDPFELIGTADLIDKRVFIGPRRSGTAITARFLMDLMGVSAAQYTRVFASGLKDVQRLLREDSVDVAMHVGTLGNRFITELLDSTCCRLFPIDRQATRRITRDIPKNKLGILAVRSIPAGTYRSQERQVTTIVVPVVLVASRPDLPHNIVRSINTLIDSAIVCVRADGGQGQMTIDKHVPRPAGLSIYHPSFWPKESGIPAFWINIFAAMVFFLTAAWAAYKHRLRIMRHFRSRTLALVLGGVVVIFLLCVIAIYSVEHSVNEDFGGLPETMWSMLICLFSGLGDRLPITTEGHFITTIVIITGPLFLAVLTGFFASSLIINALERKMAKNLKDHHVILNWSSRALEVVKQIRSRSSSASDTGVIVVVSDDPNLNLKELQKRFSKASSKRAFEDVYFCPGDPCDEQSLVNANVEDADSILIMSDDRQDTSADEKTLRSLLALQRIAENHNRPLNVVVELMNIENSKVVDNIARHFPGVVDSVAAGQMRTRLLAHTALIPGLSKFYKDLLCFARESNEVYLVELPPSAVGQTFPEYAAKVFRSDSKQPLIPVGLQRIENGEPVLMTNPKALTKEGKESPYFKLRERDKLLVISYDPPTTDELPE